MRYLQLSNDSDTDQQKIEFLHTVNTRFRNALHPGPYLTLDESMISMKNKNHQEAQTDSERNKRYVGCYVSNCSQFS